MSRTDMLRRHVSTGSADRRSASREIENRPFEALLGVGSAGIDSVLIAGAPQTGKYELATGTLGRNADHAVFATTKHAAERVETDFDRLTADAAAPRLHVVESTTRGRSKRDGPEFADVTVTGQNATTLGVALTDAVETAERSTDGRIGIGINSLSHVLLNGEDSDVYRFTKAYVDLARASESVAVATVDTGIGHADRTNALRHYFDAVVETRADPAREYRTRTAAGLGEWIGF